MQKVGDLLDDIHECAVINTACLLHSLFLSEFLFQTFSSGLRSLKTLIKIDWTSCKRSEVKIQIVLPCICRKDISGTDTNTGSCAQLLLNSQNESASLLLHVHNLDR